MQGDIEHGYTREKVAREKNYGVWNLMVEKDVAKTATVYAGIGRTQLPSRHENDFLMF